MALGNQVFGLDAIHVTNQTYVFTFDQAHARCGTCTGQVFLFDGII